MNLMPQCNGIARNPLHIWQTKRFKEYAGLYGRVKLCMPRLEFILETLKITRDTLKFTFTEPLRKQLCIHLQTERYI